MGYSTWDLIWDSPRDSPERLGHAQSGVPGDEVPVGSWVTSRRPRSGRGEREVLI